jgi:hypothetical protein
MNVAVKSWLQEWHLQTHRTLLAEEAPTDGAKKQTHPSGVE